MESILRKTGVALVSVMMISLSIVAQSPEGMSYQAVIRGINGNLVINKTVSMKISILDGLTGNVVYAETHTPTTNANGLISLTIGFGTVVTGTFSEINWALRNTAFPNRITIETDPSGGTNYTISGTNQLLSVPYAFHTKTATTTTLPFGHFYTTSGQTRPPGLDISFNFTRNPPPQYLIQYGFLGDFSLPTAGTYQVLFKLNVIGTGAVVLKLNNEVLPYTRVASTSANSPLIGTALVTTTVAESKLRLINASSDSDITLDGPDTSENRLISTMTIIQIH